MRFVDEVCQGANRIFMLDAVRPPSMKVVRAESAVQEMRYDGACSPFSARAFALWRRLPQGVGPARKIGLRQRDLALVDDVGVEPFRPKLGPKGGLQDFAFMDRSRSRVSGNVLLRTLGEERSGRGTQDARPHRRDRFQDFL